MVGARARRRSGGFCVSVAMRRDSPRNTERERAAAAHLGSELGKRFHVRRDLSLPLRDELVDLQLDFELLGGVFLGEGELLLEAALDALLVPKDRPDHCLLTRPLWREVVVRNEFILRRLDRELLGAQRPELLRRRRDTAQHFSHPTRAARRCVCAL